MAADPEWLRGAYIREDGGVINRFDQARSEVRSRDAENDLGQVSSEIRLADRAAGGRAAESHDGEEIMYAAVGPESNLTNRPVAADETEACEYRHLRGWGDVAVHLRIRVWTGSAAGRLRM